MQYRINIIHEVSLSYTNVKKVSKIWIIFTARNEVGARLYFHRRLWFCPQGGACSRRFLIPGGAWSRGGAWWRPPRDSYCCGRYAYYWNAFLLDEYCQIAIPWAATSFVHSKCDRKRGILLYLDSVVSVVEQMTSSKSVQYRIVRIVHHVVSADGRQAVPLQINVWNGRMVQVWIATLF